MIFFFCFFFLSGSCSLVYQVVWLRMAMADFGVTTAQVSIVLSVFMAGLALGSWGGGKLVRRFSSRSDSLFVRLYGLSELLIGVSGLAVAPLLRVGRTLLIAQAGHAAWGSSGYYLASGGWIALVMLPFCCCMGATFPLAMAGIKFQRESPWTFSFLYLANVLGAMAGALGSAFVFIELLGFSKTLLAAVGVNALVALSALALGQRRGDIGIRLEVVEVMASALLIAKTRDYETLYPGARVRRDHTATVIAAGQGMDKRLLMNGIGITNLTPITKMMAHLPLAFLGTRPRNVLVLCFGMGTSFRSAMSWGVPVTVVELVPSVPSLFSYFHADGDALLGSPRAMVVIDDARRYLERTGGDFDAIIVDPPPPVEAVASSLLYSPEFYEIARRRLRPGGILQQWLPRAEPVVLSAFAQAIGSSFPDVRVFPSVKGWGFHFLASVATMGQRTPGQLAANLPPGAAGDLLEWGPFQTAEEQFQAVADKEVPLGNLIGADPSASVLTDDRPVNEYYFLRRH